MHRKVRVNQTFYFVPVLLDKVNPPYNVQFGDKVRVINLPGCPKANTMGHCYVQHLDESFAGLVCTNSLLTESEYKDYLNRQERIQRFLQEYQNQRKRGF